MLLLYVVVSTENSDYVPVESQGLTFSPGQSSSSMSIQCEEFVVLNDEILEANETVLIALSSESNQVAVTPARNEAEVVIQEDAADCK